MDTAAPCPQSTFLKTLTQTEPSDQPARWLEMHGAVGDLALHMHEQMGTHPAVALERARKAAAGIRAGTSNARSAAQGLGLAPHLFVRGMLLCAAGVAMGGMSTSLGQG